MRHSSQPSFGCPCLRRLGLSTDVSSPFLRQFQLTGHAVLLRRSSGSLTVVLVTMQRGLRFALLHRLCSCKSWAGLPSRFTDCGSVLTSIKHFALRTPFKYRVMRFMFISSLSVGHKIFRVVSCTLYMLCAFVVLQLDQRLSRGCSVNTWCRHKS